MHVCSILVVHDVVVEVVVVVVIEVVVIVIQQLLYTGGEGGGRWRAAGQEGTGRAYLHEGNIIYRGICRYRWIDR